ncbi:MAG: cytochrome c biogenesis CcdA family protein [Anaerolineae bacterium]
MRRAVIVLGVLTLLLAGVGLAGRPLSVRAVPPTGEPVVRLFFFYSVECPHCQVIMKEVLPPLRAKYGDQLQIRFFEFDPVPNYEVMLKLEKEYGIKGGIPEIFVGQDVLVGEEEIRARLEPTIQKYLDAGGTDWPSPDIPVPVPGEEALISPGMATVYLAYFYKVGCQECDRAAQDLAFVERKYPNLVVRRYDIAAPESKVLNEAMSERYGVPVGKRLIAPSVFVGDIYLLGDDVNAFKLEEVVQRYGVAGSQPPWEGLEMEQAGQEIVARFRSLGVLTVIAAGLIDGLNPCAFATIIFFVSYLTFAGRRGREILFVGSAFTFGVFLTYLLFGLGIMRFVQTITFLGALGRIVYLVTALLCWMLAIISFRDFLKARQGRAEEMALKMPTAVKKRVHQVIRTGSRLRAYALVALVTGFVISALELACTGQVYLPTIIFVTSVPELRLHAVSYLLLYNLVFITPLIVVFLLAFYGTTSERMAIFAATKVAPVKLATAGLFALLGTWMLFALP